MSPDYLITKPSPYEIQIHLGLVIQDFVNKYIKQKEGTHSRCAQENKAEDIKQ